LKHDDCGLVNHGDRLDGDLCVSPAFADSPEFRRLINGSTDVCLARVALEIARDAYPDLEIEAYLRRIEGLAERVRARYRRDAKVRDILGQINWVLYVEEGMRGNDEDYSDPRNSYLNEVLDRKLGIPISLSALYSAVADHLGLQMAGVNLPLHFMLRVDEDGRTWFVDPYHGGAVYTRRTCERVLTGIARAPVALTDSVIRPCSIQVVVTRMLRNLKLIYGNLQDIPALLPIQRRLTALNRHELNELRDLGVLCIQADRHGEAIDALESYLNHSPPPDDEQEIRALLDVVRRQVAQWN
jgi:regulator of sirC expression with transglutaminase-like and TPR domain